METLARRRTFLATPSTEERVRDGGTGIRATLPRAETGNAVHPSSNRPADTAVDTRLRDTIRSMANAAKLKIRLLLTCSRSQSQFIPSARKCQNYDHKRISARFQHKSETLQFWISRSVIGVLIVILTDTDSNFDFHPIREDHITRGDCKSRKNRLSRGQEGALVHNS